MSEAPDPILSSWLAEAGHGTLEASVALKGQLSLPDGTTAGPSLCRTDRGAFLAAANGTTGRAVDLATAWPLGWDDGLLNDSLILGDERWVVPTGRGGEARRTLALGRIAARMARPPQPVIGVGGEAPGGPWCESMSPVHEAVLARFIELGEFVLAWLPTATSLTPPRAAADATGVAHLLLTRDRAARVVVSELGDFSIQPIETPPSLVAGAPLLELCDEQLELDSRSIERFAEVLPLVSLEPADRMREAAWRLARHGATGGALADRILDQLVEGQDPIVLLARAARHDSDDAAGLDRIAAAVPLDMETGERLARWVDQWSPRPTLTEGLLSRLLERATSPELARPLLLLHRTVRNLRLQKIQDKVVAVESDLGLAEHLLYVGERAEARAILEQRLAMLPAEDLASVALPQGADPCAGEGAPVLQLRVLELLAQARTDDPDPGTLAALARHQPLLPSRLDALTASSSGDLRARAMRARAVLTEGRDDEASRYAPASVRAVPDPLQVRMRHPAAREGHVLGRLQSALAQIKPPDAGLVRSYCERLTERAHPEAWQAIAEAALMLGMPVPQAFISRGGRDVGLRSHEEPSPFLLIGGAHLDPASDHFLDPAELRFAVGSELAHLHFGHSRVTSDDVWAGVWDKTTTALGATAAMLPFLRFLPTDLLRSQRALGAINTVAPDRWLRAVYKAEDAASLSARLGADPIRVVQGSAEVAESASSGLGSLRAVASRFLPAEASSDLGVDQQRLVVAHRVMQLSADRAGLVLADDPGAALRSFFLTHSHLRPELVLADKDGFLAVLSRRSRDGTPMMPLVALRAAALVAFWLSDDYVVLRDAARAPDVTGRP